uniref:Putative terminase n=1 Tax=viral metagenome TaxID=1070528 RepID=A0A6M3XNA8_9ZZZZ
MCNRVELSYLSTDIPPFTQWAEANIILPTGDYIQFEDHQRLIFDNCLTFNENGKLPYSIIVYSCVKKSGKTAINAMLMAWWAYNIEPPNEVITVANKRDQAIARGFKALKEFIYRNPRLQAEIDRDTEKEIRLKNGTTILAIPNDFAGEAGSNHGLTTWDELWGFKTERDQNLYDELTPVPTRKNSIRLITTYAGFEGESQLLEDLYHTVFNPNGTVKEDIGRPFSEDFPVYTKGELFMYWDHEARMPWQTPEYYKSQRQQLRVNNYLRLHQNLWVSSESGLFDMDKWDECVDPGHRPPLPDKTIQLWVGVDVSTKKDRSAVVSVYRDGDKVKLGPKRWWQPSPGDPMDLEETMEAYILELNSNYTILNIKFDPWQFHRSAITLKKKGLPMQEYGQSGPAMTEAGQNIYDLVQYGNIVLYECKDMRYEATCSIAKETSRGLRIMKEKSTQKIDQIVALAMAGLGVSKASGFFSDVSFDEVEEG